MSLSHAFKLWPGVMFRNHILNHALGSCPRVMFWRHGMELWPVDISLSHALRSWLGSCQWKSGIIFWSHVIESCLSTVTWSYVSELYFGPCLRVMSQSHVLEPRLGAMPCRHVLESCSEIMNKIMSIKLRIIIWNHLLESCHWVMALNCDLGLCFGTIFWIIP